jgi:hypothetical protein
VVPVRRLADQAGERTKQFGIRRIWLHDYHVGAAQPYQVGVGLFRRFGEDRGWWAGVGLARKVEIERAVEHDGDTGPIMSVIGQHLSRGKPRLGNLETVEA